MKDSKPVLRPRLDAVKPFEAVVSKPAIIHTAGWYHMWLSAFRMEDRGYWQNYARSRDGLCWERFADEVVLPLTPGANVIQSGAEWWLFYAGNRFGTTGIGLATLSKARL